MDQPLALRDYQERAVTSTLALWDSGARSVLGVMATGGGKCLAASEPVFLADGRVVPASQLVGSEAYVIGVTDLATMQQVPVRAAFAANGIRRVIEIELEDGVVLRRTEEHPLWAAMLGENVNRRARAIHAGWVAAADLRVSNRPFADGHVILCPLWRQQHGNEPRAAKSEWRTARPVGVQASTDCPPGYEWRKVAAVRESVDDTVSIEVFSDNHAFVGDAVEHNTQVFLAVGIRSLEAMEARGERGRLLILAHREELIHQPIERIRKFFPTWKYKVGAVANTLDESGQQIVVASVATLRNPKRIARLLAYGRITHVVTDECHHSPANSYQQIYAALRSAYPNLFHLGVTATPKRADKKVLAGTFDHVAFEVSIQELIIQRYLVVPRWFSIATGVKLVHRDPKTGDMVPIDSIGDDFNQGQLAEVFEVGNTFEIVVASYKLHCAGRKGVTFTVTVAGAKELCDLYNAEGIPAAFLSDKTPKDERKRILSDFRQGKYLQITNCGILTEGFDDPGIACVLMARPTKSIGLYLQMIGRGLRPAAGIAAEGEDCIILEFAPEAARDICNLADALGVRRNDVISKRQFQREEGWDVPVEPGELIGSFSWDGQAKDRMGDPDEIVAVPIDYLKKSDYTWARREGWLVLDIGPDRLMTRRTLAMSPADDSGMFHLYLLTFPKLDRDTCEMIFETDEVSVLTDFANTYARQNAHAALSSKGEPWRNHPASEPQLKFLAKLIPAGSNVDLSNIKKGAANELIAWYQARRLLKQSRLLLEQQSFV